MAQNVSRIARQAQYAAEDSGAGAAAIRAGLDPMLRDIEVQSGMASGANVLQNRLFTGGDTSTAMGNYYAALATKLPAYVNRRRAFEAEEKKKAQSGGGGGTGAGMLLDPNYSPVYGLPPVEEYLPTIPNPSRDRMRALYAGLSRALTSRGPTPGRVTSRRVGAVAE